MKKILIMTMILLGTASLASAEYSNPWKSAPDTNISSLVNDDYRIIDTNIINMGGIKGLFEIIYLQKDNQIYRCITTHMGSPRTTRHECDVSMEPEKDNL